MFDPTLIMSIGQLSDVLGDLGAAADIALRDRHGAGRIWSHAVAHGNIHVHRDPGARINTDGALVVGPNLRGRARNSIVVSVGDGRGAGELRVKDSTVVGPNVRVLASGRSHVHGRNAVVRIKGRSDQSLVSVSGQRKKVGKKIQSSPSSSSSRTVSSRPDRDDRRHRQEVTRRRRRPKKE